MNHPTRRVLALEASALFILSVAALGARYLVIPPEAVAIGNGQTVLALERALHLDVEAGLQRAIGGVPGLLGTLQGYYLVGHSYLLVAVFALVAWRRPGQWRFARDLFVAMTVVGFVMHLALPLAPPRLTPDAGVVDTLADGGTHGLRQGAFHGWFNPFAAFPSLHVGSALVLAFVVTHAFPDHRWSRWVWLHPAAMALTVIATGNHWTVDILGAAAMIVPSAAILGLRTAPRAAGNPGADAP